MISNDEMKDIINLFKILVCYQKELGKTNLKNKEDNFLVCYYVQ